MTAEKQVDSLTPPQMAAWLRETAVNTRAHSDTDRLAAHVAFRLEQAASLLMAITDDRDGFYQLAERRRGEIERLRADIESLKRYTGVYSSGWQSPFARPTDDVQAPQYPVCDTKCFDWPKCECGRQMP
jgi:hypothetical protein